jgi:hypothetical protein
MGDEREFKAVTDMAIKVIHILEELKEKLKGIEERLAQVQIPPVPVSYPTTPVLKCEHCYCLLPSGTGTFGHARCCKCGNERAATQWA